MKTNFVCRQCGATYDMSKPIWRCTCGGLLGLVRQYEEMEIYSDDHTLWRYRNLLPIENSSAVFTLGEGMTPLLEREIAGWPIHLKLEFMSPSGSFKDRGAAVLMAKVKEWGVSRIVEDTSGNSGAAIAAYAAAAGIECEIYVPEYISEGKYKQIAAYGAHVYKVPGNRDATARAAMERTQSVYYASHSWNPIFYEGTKTVAYEIWEQLGFVAPDVVIVPIGSGTMTLGLYAGFSDLLRMKQIARLPRILGVQSANCSPAYTDLHGLERRPLKPTIAEGISVGQPIRQTEILEAIRETKGEVLLVEDEDVIQGMQELSRIGIYVEPTSATVIPGYYQAREKNLISPRDRVILPLTGSGLKRG